MTEDLQEWYQHASGAEGFIGSALKEHRFKLFLTQEQQRNAIGILDAQYDQLWLRLQAYPLPRTDQFDTDMQEIVEHVTTELGFDASVVNVEQLGEFIRAGLEKGE